MVAHTIQLALAPVFVLVALGNIMNLLSGRLGRIVDRSRALQEIYAATHGAAHVAAVREMRVVDQRIMLINRAMLLLVLSAIAIGVTAALLFIADFSTAIDLQPIAAGVFILAIALLLWALLLFVHETRLATAALRIPASYLEIERSRAEASRQ